MAKQNYILSMNVSIGFFLKKHQDNEKRQDVFCLKFELIELFFSAFIVSPRGGHIFV